MNAPIRPALPLLDLDLLRTLVAIAESGSFSAAAEAVFRTPSAISMQVKKIEEILGRPVFLRDSRSVSLTPDGAFLVEHARRMLALNREAVARFVEPDLTGVVRMGAPDDVAERFLPGMLRRFADSHPGVTVNVVVDSSDRMVRMIEAGHLDMTLVTCEAGVGGSRGAEVLYREQLVWAARKGGVAAERDPLPVSVWEEGCVWRQAGLAGLEAQGRAWRLAFQSAHISGQRAAILADLAVAPVPMSALGGDIVAAAPKCGLPALPKYALGLIVAADPSSAAEAAADHLRSSFADAEG
jgi:DNA-binding transcriptional LysR family regulator